MINEWDLSETNLDRLSKRLPEVAVIPVGAIEPHNRHLPQGQDFLHTTYVAKRCTETAWQKCKSVICLPTIPFGVDCNLMDFPLAIHVSQDTLNALLSDIIKSLRHYGIKKIVIINGHGGNDFTPLIRQLQCDLDVHLFVSNWWKVAMDKYNEIFTNEDDHAGEFETSVALALYPDLVEMDKAGDGMPRDFRFDALKKGWVQTSRRFSRLNDQCAAGNPAEADAQKGQMYINLVCERISTFLIELAESAIDEDFPQERKR